MDRLWRPWPSKSCIGLRLRLHWKGWSSLWNLVDGGSRVLEQKSFPNPLKGMSSTEPLGENVAVPESHSLAQLLPSEGDLKKNRNLHSCPSSHTVCSSASALWLPPWNTNTVSTWNQHFCLTHCVANKYVLKIAKLQPSDWKVQV